MWNENDLFKMMKANCEIYGKEIKEIDSASETWAIKYFTDRLQYLLDYRAECGSKLFDVKSNGWSGIESIDFKKDVKLTAKQCVDIGNFLGCGNIYLDRYDKHPTIDYYNSKIIINYLETGYSLDGDYIFEPKYPNMAPEEISTAKCNETLECLKKSMEQSLTESINHLNEELKKHPIELSKIAPPESERSFACQCSKCGKTVNLKYSEMSTSIEDFVCKECLMGNQA